MELWRNGLLGALLLAQIAVAWLLYGTRAHWQILPPAPSERTLSALAFGDREFLYRALAMQLQNFGDTGGRLTPLRNYDMRTVVAWLRALDSLDFHADHHVTLAARYFSQTQDVPQVRHLVQYLMEHIARDPAAKVHWFAEALHMARVRLNDDVLVLALADQLAQYDFPTMSLIAHQLPAAIYERMGDFSRAADHMAIARERLRGRVGDQQMKIMDNYIGEMRRRSGED